MKVLLSLLLYIPLLALSQKGTFAELSYACQDGVERPYIVYTPKGLDQTSSKPLLIYLHGAISNANLKKDPLAYMKKSKLIKLADDGGFYLMFCYGQKGATWFDGVGTDMVLGEMAQAQEKFNIDPDKIFLSGFSDGGSGVLYLSMTNPLPFAGFIAMNGSTKVAQKLGEQGAFPVNSNYRPTYIINTTEDLLYPINQIRPVVQYLQQFNPNITFKTPEANHEMSYLENGEQEGILAFMEQHTRTQRDELFWETQAEGPTPWSWLSISKIDTSLAPATWHKPYQLEVLNDKADFGLKYDYKYSGKGLKVSGFKNEICTARKLGVQVGDVVLRMEDQVMESPYSPSYYTGDKKAGDPTALTVLRGEQELTLEGNFNEGYHYPVFDHKKPSAKINARIANKQLLIHTSRVAAINIDRSKLHRTDFDQVYFNDQLIESGSGPVQVLPVE